MKVYNKILLTGASGFIGKNILEQLGGKYEFIAPSHKDLDLLDAKAVENFLLANPVDVVIHAANIGVSRKDSGMDNVGDLGLKMFLNLAEALKKDQKMIFLGSGAEYNKGQELKQVKEEDFGKSIPVDEYGFSKYSASKHIDSVENIINLRCFGVYGKYEDSSQRFVSTAILDVLANRPITIGQNVWFDYLYVDDLVKIIDFFITHEAKYKFYNTTSGQRVDLLTIAGIVQKVSGSHQEILVKREGLNKEYTADNTRLREELSNFEFSTLEQGIKALYKYYLNLK